MSSTSSPPRGLRGRAAMSPARVLESGTRARIYEHLRRAGGPLTVRDVAAAFGLHPNVVRTHLRTLAEAGLLTVGSRKHAGGGRPAALFAARDDPDAQLARGDPAEGQARLLARLLVRVLQSAPGDSGPVARAHDVAVAEGRRLVSALSDREEGGGLAAAARTAVRALRPYAPDARVTRVGGEWAEVAGLEGLGDFVAPLHAGLGTALQRGLLSGALAAAGVPATLSDGAGAAGRLVWRARAAGPATRSDQVAVEQLDARGVPREAAVVRAMRAIVALGGGEVLEVLTEGPGSPAAFARWADRAGHQLLAVERFADHAGRPAIRLLIRKGA